MAQALGDLLSASFGHDVQRPQLDAFVAQSQARNGLVSQQTQEALLNAQKLQEEADARSRLPQAIQETLGPDAKPSDGQMAADLMINKYGNATDVLQFLNRARLSNSSLLGTANQTAAQQGVQGKVAEPVAVPNNFTTLPGSAPVNPQQTAEGAAQTADMQSQTRLRNAQAAAGGFNPHTGGGQQQHLDPVMAAEAAEFIRQNPNLAGNFRSLLSNGGPDVIHAFLHPAGGVVPPSANGLTPAPGVDLKEQANIKNDFSNGLGARQTTALGTMVQHSQLFDAIADQLENGDFAPSNYVRQLWNKTFGNPAPTNLQTAAGFLGREAIRATVNAGAGTGQERELQVNENSAPDVLHGAANTLRSLAKGQLNSLDMRARRGGVDIAQLLVPEAQAVFGRHPILGGGPMTAPGADPAKTGLPSYASEQEALAAGHKAGDRVIIGGVSGTLQ